MSPPPFCGKFKRSDLLIIVILLCLGGWLFFILINTEFFKPVFIDTAINALVAKNLVEGKGYSIFGSPHLLYPPFYPFFIAIFYSFLRDMQSAAMTASVVSFLMPIVAIYALAGYLYGRIAAIFAALIYLSHLEILNVSVQGQSHSVDLLLITIVISLAIFLMRGKELNRGHYVLLGILMAFAILNRPENVILTLSLGFVLFFQISQRFRRKIGYFLIVVLTCLALLSPYAYFLYRHTGKVMITSKVMYLEFYSYMSEKDPLAARGRSVWPHPVRFDLPKYVKSNYKEIGARYVKGLDMFFGTLKSISGGFTVCALTLIGFIGYRRDRELRRVDALLFSTLAPLIILPLGPMYPRYFLFILPALLLWAGRGFKCLVGFFGPVLSRRSIVFILICVAILRWPSGLVAFAGAEISEWAACRSMAVWMRDNVPDIKDRTVLCNEGDYYSFYAGFDKFVNLQARDGTAAAAENIRMCKVDYVILDSDRLRCFDTDIPGFSGAINDSKGGFVLEEVYSVTGSDKKNEGRTIGLFAVRMRQTL